jgi:hypothetical protein
MKKIEKFTPEQEAKFPEYVEKWSKIGCDTARLDPTETERIIHNFQKNILTQKETPVVIFNNPNECWVACNYAAEGIAPENLKHFVDNFFENPKGKREMEIEVGTPVFPYQEGSFFVSVFSFYDFMFTELGIEVEPELYKLYKMWEETSALGLIYPLENVCIVSEKPSVIHLNESNQLHRDGGPALEYAGHSNFKIYSLNGVTVDEYLAVTPSEQLDLAYYNTIKNADAKTEFVRKFGVDRMIDIGNKIDSYENYNDEWWSRSEYELYDMSGIFTGVPYAPHLKMSNQTTGVYHVEAVSPQCRTLADAIKERLGGRELKITGIA